VHANNSFLVSEPAVRALNANEELTDIRWKNRLRGDY
jgi:hypothetical protein